ncbi:MAG: penicillin-binding transpeptidase domain-containing protein [Candidatus Wolfebacteria bacterium]|nr:penicillin-binding transpeptidase domain-containing protein [Candidatus Wolfebacteria bacterium]
MKKPNIFLEEAILDDFKKDFGELEMPLSKKAFNLVVFFAGLIVLISTAQIFSLGIGKGDLYKNRAQDNISDITTLAASRGIFFDRYNKTLVTNMPSFRVVLDIPALFLKNKDEQKAEIGKVSDILGINFDDIEKSLLETDLEKQRLLIIARDLTIEEVAKIKVFDSNVFRVENDFKRQYPDGGIFSHILGYIGAVDKKDLKNDEKLLINDSIGKDGLEFYYDNYLRGQAGKIVKYKNSKNKIIEEKFVVDSTSGDNFYLTIDSDFQNYFFNRFKQGLSSIGRTRGAGVAINPQTGEVLALVSIPTFDNNHLSSGIFSDLDQPLFNRIVSGVYNPGSTIKPLVAVAALNERVVTPATTVFSKGYIEIPNPYFPDKPSRFLDWRPNGLVNVYSALAKSSNIYFYAAGGGYQDIGGLGVKRLKDYWQKFMLDQKTGIDLPGEKKGFLPDPVEKEKRTGTIWRLGDTYNVSIGQGDLMITPLELINYISSIANGGKIFQPFVVKKITDEKGDLIKENSPKIIADNTDLLNSIKEVKKGMIDGVEKSYGTSNLLSDLPVKVAAKTGSAQIEQNTKVNAFFVGFAPADQSFDTSKIAILILVEDAREGSLNTIPIAKDVLKWYYENRLK